MQSERERISKLIDNYCAENGEELFISSGYFAHEDLINLILQEKQASYQQGVIDTIEKMLEFTKPWLEDCLEFPSMVAGIQRKIFEMYKRKLSELKQSAQKEQGE